MLRSLRPPIFADALRDRAANARESSAPASPCHCVAPSLRRSVASRDDCRPDGYRDWTPGDGPFPGARWRDPPERHGPRRLVGVLIVLAVSVGLWLVLFGLCLLFAQFGK